MKINEIFYSIQGEGVTMGIPTIFVRLTGCNLDCKWCDTAYARTEGKEMNLDQIMEEIRKIRCTQVCITGGEPMYQPETVKLIDVLLGEGYLVTLETNGSKNLEALECSEALMISMDVKCPGSGQSDKMDLSNLELLGPTDQLKFVVSDRTDYEYARDMIKKYHPICAVVMTPVWGVDIAEVIKWVLKDKLDVRVLPQLHKLVWGDERGH
ncbi:MAG: radical SAM protein [Candidatus Thermoplasmatota archaeon]|nr:radical SAM protein [Euryarchaeota archaeon]MBU4032452.1 radical SAM protein [Candidatus Thermoplasmatota archaeon]MBU4071565.1 radical SAM protein [Candidatus Thermoplasmatota archaeon]MBU4144468.1 radical SAM protein [Candidatus Thermoplasmatota archaeon]MBU4592300.1 radical SAM protein [Candidatus Thermoplasmatota archaeon]